MKDSGVANEAAVSLFECCRPCIALTSAQFKTQRECRYEMAFEKRLIGAIYCVGVHSTARRAPVTHLNIPGNLPLPGGRYV